MSLIATGTLTGRMTTGVAMSDDTMDKYDEVVQMQLFEFQRHILGATNADLCVVLVEANGVAQCATGSRNMGEEEGRGKSVALLSQTAAAMIEQASDGKFELLLRDNRTGEILPAGYNCSTRVVTV